MQQCITVEASSIYRIHTEDAVVITSRLDRQGARFGPERVLVPEIGKSLMLATYNFLTHPAISPSA